MDLQHFYYLITLLTIPIPFVYVAVRRLRLKVILMIIGFSTLIGIPWEILAVKFLKIWIWNPDSTLSFWLFGIFPFEELLFYLWVSIAIAGVAIKVSESARKEKPSSLRSREEAERG